MTRVIFILICLALLVSCRSTRKIQTAISKKDTTAAVRAEPSGKSDSSIFVRNVLRQMDANRIDFSTFSAKVDLDYRDAEGKKYDLNANIRMQKDSIIWVSVSAILGIEAMRVLITKDSVKLLDKLNKTFTARSVDYLQEVTALPLDLPTLQNLLVGNPVFFDTTAIASVTRSSDVISLLSVGRWFKNLITVADENKKLLRSKLDDVNIIQSRTADLTYSDYEDKKNKLFATKRRIAVAEKKKLDINLNFKQYTFDESLTYPFSIPKNYKTQ
ncbi:MAG: DUF4292 domain-containing protein [Bacteroidota bacterium]|nr:DUF4292 domain-containing protein [Bacteroidota bacterium]